MHFFNHIWAFLGPWNDTHRRNLYIWPGLNPGSSRIDLYCLILINSLPFLEKLNNAFAYIFFFLNPLTRFFTISAPSLFASWILITRIPIPLDSELYSPYLTNKNSNLYCLCPSLFVSLIRKISIPIPLNSELYSPF